MKEAGSAASLKAAQEAAAKVNAMLVASGQLKLSELNKNRTKNNKSNDLFIEEVVINDAPMSARNFLTRSSTQEEISKMSGAAVSTRGRYMNQEERKNPSKSPSDRPLYLHIQAVNQQDVKVAVGRITHIIMEHSHRKGHSMQRLRGPRPNPAPGLMGPRPGSGSRGPRPLVFQPPQPDMSAPPPPPPAQPQPPPSIFREKVFLPMNIGLNPNDIQARLIGESGMNLRYIQEETGVAISIRGIGSGFQEGVTGQEAQDPLHFYLEHDNQDQFNQAKDLVVNLAQTVISEVQQEIQQQQQQQQHQHQQMQQQQPTPLFTQPPPQQPDMALGNGQPHLAQVPVVPHQLTAPPAPPSQMVHSQMVPPQAPPHSQMVPPHVGHPQMPPAQVAMQGQVGGPQVGAGVMHTVLAPHLQQPGAPVSQEVMPQQEVIQATVVSLPQQVIHLAAPPVVSSTAAVANQQLVHTSSGTQLVTLPPGTQIINMPDGPRLVALAPGGTQVAPPVPAGHQTPHPASLHDPQGAPNPLLQQQQPTPGVPQSMAAVSGATGHLAISQTPIQSDGSAPPPMARSMGPTTSFSAPSFVNTVSTSSPLTNAAAPHSGPPDTPFPSAVNASIPPPNTSMALGVPPPAALGLPPAATANAGNVSFVLTSGANTLTTTSGMGLLMPQDQMHHHVTQPVVVTGVMPSLQQQQHQHQHQPHHHHHHHHQPGAPSSFLGHLPPQPLSHSGYSASQSHVEQQQQQQQPAVSSAYLAPESGYNGPPVTTNATHHYGQVPPQQQQRPVSVAYAPMGLAGPGETGAHGRTDFPTGAPTGVLPLNSLPPRHPGQKGEQQQQQQQPLQAGPGHYSSQQQQQQQGHQDLRPMSLEQQWQQFQQQVKMEGGQQQYDPYAAATEESDHQDPARQSQSVHPGAAPSQQQQPPPLSSQAPSSLPSSHQQYRNFLDQANQQQQQQPPLSEAREGESCSPGTLAKEAKTVRHGSPLNLYSHYYGRGPQNKRAAPPPPSPERQDQQHQQPPPDHRYHGQQQQRASPQAPGHPPQQQFQQGQFQGQLVHPQEQSSVKHPETTTALDEQQQYSAAAAAPNNKNNNKPTEGLLPHMYQPQPQPQYLATAPPQHQPPQQSPSVQEVPESQQYSQAQVQAPSPSPLQQGQCPPGVQQYPWAQYPQPAAAAAAAGHPQPFPSGTNNFGNAQGPPGPYPNSPGPYSGQGGGGGGPPPPLPGPPNITSYPPMAPGGGPPGPSPYPGGGSAPPPPPPAVGIPLGPGGGAEERQTVVQDKKAEPGVATRDLLLPLAPPPPPSDILLSSRTQEEAAEASVKRQRSCSPQDERRATRRHTTESDDRAGSRSLRARGHEAPGREGDGHYSPPRTFRSGLGGYADGGRQGGFPSGLGSFMGHGGPWGGWRPMPGLYSEIPMRTGPYNRPPGGGVGTTQSAYGRNPRDRSDIEDGGGGGTLGGGGSRRLGRGGGYTVGGRGNRDRRW